MQSASVHVCVMVFLAGLQKELMERQTTLCFKFVPSQGWAGGSRESAPATPERPAKTGSEQKVLQCTEPSSSVLNAIPGRRNLHPWVAHSVQSLFEPCNLRKWCAMGLLAPFAAKIARGGN